MGSFNKWRLLSTAFLLGLIAVPCEQQRTCRAVCETLCDAVIPPPPVDNSLNYWWSSGEQPGYPKHGNMLCRDAGGNCMPIGWCGTARYIQADCDMPSGQVCCFDVGLN